MMKRGRRERRAGFSLVEVTVVTGILATLAGQSGSAYMQAKNKASADQCLNNLKQLHMAILMVADENEGRLPKAWFFPWKGSQTDSGWKLDPSDPYNIANIVAGRNSSVRQLFICPGAPEPWQKLGITYVYNDTLGGRMLDSLPNPSAVWLLMDANVINLEKFPAPHLDGYNVLYCDGHAKWVPRGMISQVFRAGLMGQQGNQGGGGGGGGGEMDDIW